MGRLDSTAPISRQLSGPTFPKRKAVDSSTGVSPNHFPQSLWARETQINPSTVVRLCAPQDSFQSTVQRWLFHRATVNTTGRPKNMKIVSRPWASDLGSVRSGRKSERSPSKAIFQNAELWPLLLPFWQTLKLNVTHRSSDESLRQKFRLRCRMSILERRVCFNGSLRSTDQEIE